MLVESNKSIYVLLALLSLGLRLTNGLYTYLEILVDSQYFFMHRNYSSLCCWVDFVFYFSILIYFLFNKIVLNFSSSTSHDIQLQCLDAKALLQRTTTSTPASSLDLEWEHETLPISMVHDPSGSSW